MKKSLLIISILVLQSFFCLAFEGVTIKGRVLDPDNNAMLFANVLLKTSADSMLYKGEITNEAGLFFFEHVKEGDYFLEINVPGFEKTTVNSLHITAQDTLVDIGDIIIKPLTNELATVTVQAEKPFIEQQIGRAHV